MPEEIFIIVVVAILAGTFTTSVKAVLGYLEKRGGGSSGGVTTSELEAMMRRAVEEGTVPLHARLDALEQKALLPHEDPDPALPERASEPAP